MMKAAIRNQSNLILYESRPVFLNKTKITALAAVILIPRITGKVKIWRSWVVKAISRCPAIVKERTFKNPRKRSVKQKTNKKGISRSNHPKAEVIIY